mmetsp:Transcript_23447/g.34794  ORF Transcript_23447/g.34794 Transcript_23447/m.34794 type:complete len:628 (-) Transcript_23447:90-1973(-)
MKVPLIALTGAFATADAKNINIQLGGKRHLRRGDATTEALLQKAVPFKNNKRRRRRHLEGADEQANEVDGSYSISFGKCIDIKTKSEDLFNENFVDQVKNGSALSLKSYALFYACQDSYGNGCSEDESDVYMVDLSTYLSIVGMNQAKQRGDYCEKCEENQEYCAANVYEQSAAAYGAGNDGAYDAEDDGQAEEESAEDQAEEEEAEEAYEEQVEEDQAEAEEAYEEDQEEEAYEYEDDNEEDNEEQVEEAQEEEDEEQVEEYYYGQAEAEEEDAEEQVEEEAQAEEDEEEVEEEAQTEDEEAEQMEEEQVEEEAQAEEDEEQVEEAQEMEQDEQVQEQDEGGARKLKQQFDCGKCDELLCFLKDADDDAVASLAASRDEIDTYVAAWIEEVANCKQTGYYINGQPVYIGPICSDYEDTFEIGAFLDEDCTILTNLATLDDIVAAEQQANESVDVTGYAINSLKTAFYGTMTCEGQEFEGEDGEEENEMNDYCKQLFESDLANFNDCAAESEEEEGQQEETDDAYSWYSYDMEDADEIDQVCAKIASFNGEYSNYYDSATSGSVHSRSRNGDLVKSAAASLSVSAIAAIALACAAVVGAAAYVMGRKTEKVDGSTLNEPMYRGGQMS